MRKIIDIGNVLLALFILSGCGVGEWTLPIRHGGTPDEYEIRINTIESLYGKHIQEIYDQIGKPDWVNRINPWTYYIYVWSTEDTAMPVWIVVPIPIIESYRENLYCLLLKFDEDDKLLFHDTKSLAFTDTHITPVHECKIIFPDINESLAARNLVSESRLHCPMADNGNADSQYRIGNIHYYGNYFLERNLIRAFVWYNLSADAGNKQAEDRLNIVASELTSQQLKEAQSQLSNWEPGQCVNELTPVSSRSSQELRKEVGVYCPNADLGHADAQYQIGNLYYKSYGTPKRNLIRAYVWYSLSAIRGHEQAARRAREIEYEFTPEQLSQAKTELKQWKPGRCSRDLLEEIAD